MSLVTVLVSSFYFKNSAPTIAGEDLQSVSLHIAKRRYLKFRTFFQLYSKYLLTCTS